MAALFLTHVRSQPTLCWTGSHRPQHNYPSGLSRSITRKKSEKIDIDRTNPFEGEMSAFFLKKRWTNYFFIIKNRSQAETVSLTN